MIRGGRGGTGAGGDEGNWRQPSNTSGNGPNVGLGPSYQNQYGQGQPSYYSGGGMRHRQGEEQGRHRHHPRGGGVTGGRGGSGYPYQNNKPNNKVQEDRDKEPEEFTKVVGTCMDMCPRSELILREREGLLHPFEILLENPVTEEAKEVTVHHGRGRMNNVGRKRKPLPKADIKRIIKSFARSAAGQDKTVPADLRPAQVLLSTVNYLNQWILPKTDCPFNVVYDFMFDRLRAVRQDLVIQRIEDENAIQILECIVRFHIHSEYRLRKEDISIYDPHINQKHLADCLRKLLSLYQYNKYNKPSRAEFEALNCLVYVESYDVISRAFEIRKCIKSPLIDTAIDMALAYQCRNFVRFFHGLVKLPISLRLYCVRYIRSVRERALNSICMAYGVNTCKIPCSWLSKLLLYPSERMIEADLMEIGTEIIKDEDGKKFAKFQKLNVDVIKSKSAKLTTEIKDAWEDTNRNDALTSLISGFQQLL